MFAYCGNNPVSRKDDGGEFWHIVIGAAVGAAVSFASSVISDVVSGEKIDWVGAGISAAFGAASGALAATGLGAVAQVAGGAVLSGAENAIEQGREKGFDNIDYGEVAVNSIIGGVTSRNNGVSKDVSNHLYKQAAVATKRLKSTRKHTGFTAMLKAVKPTVKYYFSQTNTLFYKPLVNDSLSTLISDAKDAICGNLYITAS